MTHHLAHETDHIQKNGNDSPSGGSDPKKSTKNDTSSSGMISLLIFQNKCEIKK